MLLFRFQQVSFSSRLTVLLFCKSRVFQEPLREQENLDGGSLLIYKMCQMWFRSRSIAVRFKHAAPDGNNMMVHALEIRFHQLELTSSTMYMTIRVHVC